MAGYADNPYDIEDSPDLPASVLPLSPNDPYFTPGPLFDPTQTHRQPQIAQNPHQNMFDSWNLGLGLGVQQVCMYSPSGCHSNCNQQRQYGPHTTQQSQPGSHTTHTSQPLVIAKFDHNTLLQNQVYRDLYHENIQLKSQLIYSWYD
jgi:hypothetical protein